MKAIGQYFPMLLLIMLYKVVLNLKFKHEVQMWDQPSNKSYSNLAAFFNSILSCDVICYAVHVGFDV